MVKFGVFLPFYAFGFNGERYRSFELLKEIVLECEKLGYHSVWIDDHLMYGDKPVLECWTTLSALSTLTSRIRLGTMVLCNAFRNPAVMAKMAATLDLISHGRLELGLGVGAQREEHEAYGLEFPTLRVRADRLKEAIEVMKRLWVETEATFHGRYYRMENAICQPKPMQKPHPPIVIGGCSNPVLEVTAKHADRFDWGPVPLEKYRTLLQTLEKRCRRIGRDPDTIEKASWLGGTIYMAEDLRRLEANIAMWKPAGMSTRVFKKQNLLATPEKVIGIIQEYLDLDVTFFMLYFGDLPEKSSIRIFAEKVVREFL
ncbi:MAG: LLM class flavin-dependent oxidoreductase [Nitrososphaerota archaeon]|nr:LLM class flavin-dependent oxidoreductase [Candidatus Bathyarchaeota archaeon]MDW8194010.1 LLM class flavin-dependent oxidoreductase [Nitrososphaerota archaeon]